MINIYYFFYPYKNTTAHFSSSFHIIIIIIVTEYLSVGIFAVSLSHQRHPKTQWGYSVPPDNDNCMMISSQISQRKPKCCRQSTSSRQILLLSAQKVHGNNTENPSYLIPRLKTNLYRVIFNLTQLKGNDQ